MRKMLKNISSYFIALILFVFSFYTIFHYSNANLFDEAVSNNFFVKNTVLFGLLILVLFLVISIVIFKLFINYKKFHYLIIILCALIPRILVYIQLYNLTPAGDFATYNNLAKAMSENTIILERYVSLFPHVMGYSYILSLVYKVFGQNPYTGQIFNIILSVFIALVIYEIGKSLDSTKFGLLASLMWCLFPSQILYVAMLCTEYLYTLLFLISIYLFLKRKNIYYYILIAIVCALSNSIRPIGMITIITFILYDIFFSEKLNLKKFVCISAMIISYIFCQKLIDISIFHKINTEITNQSVGFTLYVGMNYEGKGMWNLDDSKYFSNLSKDISLTPTDIHNILKEEGTKRAINLIKDNKLIEHLKNKHEKMWLTDHQAILNIKTSYVNDEKVLGLNTETMVTYLSNIYYYFSIFSLLLGIFFYLKNKKYELSIFIIVIIGTIFLHMISEVSTRYHFACISLFVFIGAYGITKLADKIVLKKFKL